MQLSTIETVTLKVVLADAAIEADVNPATPNETATQTASLVNWFKLYSFVNGTPGSKIANLEDMSQSLRAEVYWSRVDCSPIRRFPNEAVEIP